MVITGLTKQQKGNRYNLEIDGDFVCGLDSSLLSAYDLFVGKEINDKTIKAIEAEDHYKICLEKAFRLLAIRLNSETELRRKLNKKFDRKSIDRTISRLKELKYLDDEQFIISWVESRERSRGTYLLKRELSYKGINKALVDKYFEAREKETDYKNALSIVGRKRWRETDEREKAKKIGALLARRGFDYETIKKIISQK